MQIIKNNKRTPDLTGTKFGFLTIKKFNGYKTNYTQFWECLCDCGNTIIVSKPNLTNNHTKSCGCYKNYKHCTTHKMADSRVYNIWIGMKQRCNNPNYAPFNGYGARGIKVCDRWLESFENFLADIGEPPTAKHSIDRIDNNGDYELSNCRWATQTQQANNKRNTLIIEYKNEKKPFQEWCRIFNINNKTAYSRFSTYGWDFGKTFNIE